MIPSTLVGLLLFILLLVPGLAYVLRIEQVFPAPAHSQLREALRIIVVSVASLTITGLLLALVRFYLPERSFNFRGLIRDPGPFFRDHHVHLTWWALGSIAAATLIGWLMAEARIMSMRRRMRPKESSDGRVRRAPISDISAWRRTFVERVPPNTEEILVGARIAGDIDIYGFLDSFNPQAREDEQRELTLRKAQLRTPDGTVQPLGQMTVLSAKQIVFMDVSYLDAAGVAAELAERTSDEQPPVPPKNRRLPALAIPLGLALVVAMRAGARRAAARRHR